jgi:sigma-B regulation protein RsbU (phosphoserine phosphatase)
MSNKTENSENEKLFDTIKNDFKTKNVKRSMSKEFEELTDYFLSDEQKFRLKYMGKIKSWFYLTGWLLKSLILKLTPFRRLLLLAGLIFILISRQNEGVADVFGGLILLLVILLELKDKIFAKDELDAGRKIQYALMPDRMPEIDGWSAWLYTSPANEVGGDLIDFQEINNKDYGICLGDVSGKGLGAALLMSKLQSTIRALAPESGSLKLFGEKLNKIFYQDSPPKSFASLVYLLISKGSDNIKLFNAGHIPPFIIKKNSIQELQKGSPALGLMTETSINEISLAVSLEDILVIYSDGITEARNEQGDFFGKERLLKVLNKTESKNPKDIGEEILNKIFLFKGDAKSYDDLSIIIIKKIS